nr:hypothetical protein [Tanacetum cinerariifolium]
MSRYYPSKDKEIITGRRSQVRDLDSREKFKTSTLGEIVSLEMSNKNVDVAPLVPKLRKNRTAHTDYIRHTQEEAATLREIVERTKLVAVTPKNKTKQIRLTEQITKSGKMERKVKREVEEIETQNLELDHKVTKLAAKNKHLKQTYKQLYDSIKSSRVQSKEQCDDLITKVNLKSAEVSDLNASLQEKVLMITTLKEQLNKLKGKAVLTEAVSLNPIGRALLQVDVAPLVHKLRKNRTVHTDYIRHTQEEAVTLREIVESERLLSPLNTSLAYALTPKNKTKQIRRTAQNTKSEKTTIATSPSANIDSNTPVLSSTGVTLVRLNVLVRRIRTDNRTEFVNKTLRDYYEEVGISHETSVARSPQQNRVVERRNRTLIEAARTIKLPDLSFFHVFGALCYPTNDSENLGKLQPRADIGVFIGYAPTKKAFRIYNQRTRRIVETIHVDFDELTAMASKQSSLGPALHGMTPGTISLGLVHTNSSSTSYVPPLRNDWDLLFQPMFDELLNPPPSGVNQAPEAIAPFVEVIPPVNADLTGSPSSTMVEQDAPSTSNSTTPSETLARQGLVRGLPKLKFKKDHLCSACAMGKSTKKTHKPKSEDTNQEKLYLLHMDLYGPMRNESVNGKKYILVIVNDYSRFTWVKFLRSKDETSDFIIKFLKMIQVRLKVLAHRIRIDNGTEFVNQTLRDYYEETPYELLHSKLPDLSFFHVFGALCYPTNDSENLGKLQPKADIGIFVGYAPSKKAFRIYNLRTRQIVETIHVDFDELTAMASVQRSSGPVLHEMTPGTISSGLVHKTSPSTSYVPPSRNDWDLLFQPMFDELLNPPTSVVNQAPEDIAPIDEVIPPVNADSIGSPSSITVEQDAPST